MEKRMKYLIDTDILIDISKGSQKAVEFLEKLEGDISISVVTAMEVVVSWNMQHIVKLKTIIGVNKINKECGYSEIMINTPEEVLE